MTGTLLAGEDAPRASVAELELALARAPGLYLVVDVGAGAVDVRARGIVLDRALLKGVWVTASQPLVGRGQWPWPGLPVVWRVTEPPGADWRAVLAPQALREYEEEPALDAPAVPASPVQPELPASYLVAVDSGWQIQVSDRRPVGALRHLLASAADGWRRLTGRRRPPSPPRLVLCVEREDARWLLHIFRPDLPVLLWRGPARASGAGGA